MQQSPCGRDIGFAQAFEQRAAGISAAAHTELGVVEDVLDDQGAATAAGFQELGLDVTYLHLDVSKPEDWQAAHELIESRHGRLDILVNNAGIVKVTPLDEESLEGWNRIININLTGAFLGLKTMIPLLRLGKNSAVYTIEVQADGQ